MTQHAFKGGKEQLALGNLPATADIRAKVLMSNTSAWTDTDAENLSEIATLGEYDGFGYAEVDLAGITFAYVDADDRWYWNADDDNFGTTVAAASFNIKGLMYYLYVDGTPANDIPLIVTDEGTFSLNGSGDPIELTIPPNGFMYIGSED